MSVKSLLSGQDVHGRGAASPLQAFSYVVFVRFLAKTISIGSLPSANSA